MLFIFLEPGTKDKYLASRMPPGNYKTKCLYITKTEDMIPDSDFQQLLVGVAYHAISIFQNASCPR